MGRNRRKLSDTPFELEITSVDSKGLGLAEHEGKKLHVLDTLEGEKVLARYLFGRNNRGKAETLEVLKPSSNRVQPRCAHFGDCSACSLQHVSMDIQLARKEAALLEQLQDLGQVQPAQVYPSLSGPLWNYRRKARLSVRDVAGKGRVLVGFRERNGRYVADMAECHILRTEIADALPDLSGLIETLDCRATIPQIEVACGDTQSALIVRHLEELSQADNDRLCTFSEQSGLGIYLQPGGPESIHLLAPVDLQLVSD